MSRLRTPGINLRKFDQRKGSFDRNLRANALSPKKDLTSLRGFHTLSIITAATLLATSCVSPGNDDLPSGGVTEPSPESEDNHSPSTTGAEEAIATSLSNAAPEGESLKFDIFSLERHSDELLVLNMRITNTGSEEAYVFQTLSEPEGGGTTTADGISLIDTLNMKRYMPLKLTDGETCHCSDWSGQQDLAPGGSIDIWTAFPSPPSDVTQVTVNTPITPDFIDIPITDPPSPNTSITEAPVSTPRILDVSSLQENINEGTTRSHTGDETSVILSSDVLFDVNKSTLTTDADESLQKLAREIDESSTETVQIDGYTDSTGNNSINIPLSEDRAMAVQERLSELVTRNGIDFESAGHGSKDPVGNNETEEGRQKNRRVTVTFTK